jgi:hypothetical protein
MAHKTEVKSIEILISELKNSFYPFGGKGDVFSNTAHITNSSDGTHRTLCGKPMLSHNYVVYQGVKNIGCVKCINEYNKI